MTTDDNGSQVDCMASAVVAQAAENAERQMSGLLDLVMFEAGDDLIAEAAARLELGLDALCGAMRQALDADTGLAA